MIKIVKEIRCKTSEKGQKAVVIIDAGIATEENLKLLTDNMKQAEYIFCVHH